MSITKTWALEEKNPCVDWPHGQGEHLPKYPALSWSESATCGVISKDHRLMQGTLGCHQAQPHTQNSVTCEVPLPGLIWQTSKHGDHTVSLGSLFQCTAAITGKRFLLLIGGRRGYVLGRKKPTSEGHSAKTLKLQLCPCLKFP